MFIRRKLFWGAASASFAIAGVSFVSEGGFRKSFRLMREVESVRRSNGELREEIRGLRYELKALTTDPATRERVAREELGFVRPGELVFVLDSP